ncbi:trigger factor [Actinotalea fermentans]|uniref:Trigger factor n=1 Tax=Actinotalea fermentans TaxID=43671 RepID=A0A511YW02_9CELL|nr:trigger factor [Actinotalea fermentans]KGM17407.1 trigger factor [Actinotalea fermentans ATCC 43279 = JCM 9966 = DSM 3133]GEN79404.1 trigger factor [Actinotalea fermentans]
MKSAVETLDATTVKLTVEVSGDELKPSIDHAYEHIGSQVQIPGFRKGKVPPRILDQRVGRAAVIEHAVNDGLPGFYGQAVNEAGLRPLGQPEIEVTEVPALTDPEAGLTFTAQVEVRPDIELPALDSLTVTVSDLEVTDEDVDARLDALRERFGTLVGVDRPAADGDYVVIDLRAVQGEAEIDSVSGVSYQIGSGNLLEGLDEALTGLSAGETTTFEAPLAGGEHAGEPAQVTVTATSVKVRDLPAADDDFAQLASEFDTIAELRDDLREQASRIKSQNRAVEAREALMAALREAVEVPVPTNAVQNEVHRHLESEGRLEDENHRAEVEESTRAELVERILLDTLAEKLAVQVSQEELLDFMVNAAAQYGMDPSTFVQTVDRQGQLPAMVGEVARSKAMALALRQVKVVDGAGAEVDLSEFIGSDETDEVEVDEAPAAEETDDAAPEDAKA